MPIWKTVIQARMVKWNPNQDILVKTTWQPWKRWWMPSRLVKASIINC